MKEKISLKDGLFNLTKVHKIAREIQAVYAVFDLESFEDQTLQKFPELELKERIYHIRNMLRIHLPNDYIEATTILLNALPKALDTTLKDNDFGDFVYAPYSEFVAAYGCNEKYVDFSLDALREITQRFSVEFAIRDFINTFPDKTLKMLESCSLSDNYHERRLASEGLRPKLPWAKKLTLDYHEAMRYLDNLFYDDTRYVTRSVANHLNDISKIDAKSVLTILKKWQASGKQKSKEMNYIISHALRTLVKQGNEEALAFLGYSQNPLISVTELKTNSTSVNIGESIVFSCEITAKSDVSLLIDYIVHFRTKNGSYSPKVHKLKKLVLKSGETLKLEKNHKFKANMTTRKVYTGEHKIELQINGSICSKIIFELMENKTYF